jgi:hypothetical protein
MEVTLYVILLFFLYEEIIQHEDSTSKIVCFWHEEVIKYDDST